MEQADLITTSVNYEVDKSDVLANTTPSQANDKRDWDDYCQNAGPSSPQDAEVAGNHAPSTETPTMIHIIHNQPLKHRP